MAVSIPLVRSCGHFSFFSQALWTGPPIPALVEQLTGQQTRGLVAGVPTPGMVAGDLMVKLSCDHVVSLCFIPICLLRLQYEYKCACSLERVMIGRSQLYLSPSSKMKTVNGSNVIILDGGLVGDTLGSTGEIWSHLRSRDLP